MDSATLSVSWDDFPKVATNLFNDLSNDAAFTDVTLVSEDLQQVRAHRIVLAASSNILGNILATLNRPDPLLYLKGVQHDQLEALMGFIYQGKAEVAEHQLEGFMRAATELGIKGLLKGVGEGQEGQPQTAKPSNDARRVREQEKINTEQDSKDSLVNLRIGEVNRVLRIETQTKGTDEKLALKKVKKIKKKRATIEKLSQDQIATKPFLEDSKEALRNALEDVAIKASSKKADNDSTRTEQHLVDLVAVEAAQKDNSRHYSCNHCEYRSKNKESLKKHIIIHEGVKFTCMWDGCDQKYTSRDNVRRHMKTAHGIQGDDFGCDKCTMKFAIPEALKAHIVEAHTRKRQLGQK